MKSLIQCDGHTFHVPGKPLSIELVIFFLETANIAIEIARAVQKPYLQNWAYNVEFRLGVLLKNFILLSVVILFGREWLDWIS